MKIERQTLAQQVLDRLVLRLMESPLKPGQRVSTEQDLMEEFDVSRSSVREAVKALQNLGILESRPALGTFLSARPGTYSRLLLLASLLSADHSAALQQLIHTLELHSLLRLHHDLHSNDADLLRRSQKHQRLLEDCLAAIAQQRISTPGSKRLLERQKELRHLLLSYPVAESLNAHIGCNLGDFLLREGEAAFSPSLNACYQELVAVLSQKNKGALVQAHTQLVDHEQGQQSESENLLVQA